MSGADASSGRETRQTLPRLCEATLSRIGPGVARPDYDRQSTSVGVVHFGPGAFHRVHQAWFFERMLARDPRWAICAVSLRSESLQEALAPQDGLYTLAIRDESVAFQVIGALREILVAPRQQEAVLRRLRDARTRLVTITVTEKGYCLGADGEIDLSHPDIRHDLETPHTPLSLPGYLVEGLRLRREAGLPPLTVISCDNLDDNGARLRRAVVRLAETRDYDLARWIESEIAFPRTMVDSITPATTDALREEVAAALGLQDRWPVQREAFLQWVIEERFSSQVPDWEQAGVTLTDDVSGYDRAKLRLLNGAHSTLAYVGLLAGFATVAQAMSEPALAVFVRTMMLEDILPTLRPPRGLDLCAYVEAILKRFRNPGIEHALAQIAWDGSKKLPVRLLGTIHDNLAAGRPIARLCVPIAAWMRFVRNKALSGARAVDPLSDELYDIGRACTGEPGQDVARFLALRAVFPSGLAAEPGFVAGVQRAYELLGADARAIPERLRDLLPRA